MNLKINDRIKIRTIDFFNNFRVDLRYDSVGSSFAFNFYFDPLNPDQEELACVSHFHEAIVEHNGERLITGYILSENFSSSSIRQMTQFSGYSLPGVLEDCNIPVSIYPLQTNGLSLKQIASKVLAPFKLKMVVDPLVESKMNLPYKEVTAEATQTVKDFLTELAAQRNIIISHDSFGNVLFTQAKTNQLPILDFEDGLIGTTMGMSFSGQQIHSEITVMKQADSDGGNASQYTISNPYVPIVYRPKTIIQTSGDDNSVQEAAQNALAAELKNIVLTIKTDRWMVDGKIIRPNNLVSVLSPELYIYKKTNFFIEAVSFEGDQEKMTATLTCVLPEVYNGKTPKNIFVDAHKNRPRE
jgi:prophage tail gpP-like protein